MTVLASTPIFDGARYIGGVAECCNGQFEAGLPAGRSLGLFTSWHAAAHALGAEHREPGGRSTDGRSALAKTRGCRIPKKLSRRSSGPNHGATVAFQPSNPPSCPNIGQLRLVGTAPGGRAGHQPLVA